MESMGNKRNQKKKHVSRFQPIVLLSNREYATMESKRTRLVIEI